MHDILKAIIATKKDEVAKLKQKKPQFAYQTNTKSFKAAIEGNSLSIIGEVKRKSPSKGALSTIKNPIELVKRYVSGGVSAISVLTDYFYFGGTQDDLQSVVGYLKNTNIPVLRKDFIIDPIQIEESLQLGANAILLIVAVLQEKTKGLLEIAKSNGLDVIVEVHTKSELELAIDSGADIIGVNNRNLNDFSEDLTISYDLYPLIPETVVSISESAIRTMDDINTVSQVGFNAALIGEGLVTLSDPNELLSVLRQPNDSLD